jgi:hypothetical protein
LFWKVTARRLGMRRAALLLVLVLSGFVLGSVPLSAQEHAGAKRSPEVSRSAKGLAYRMRFGDTISLRTPTGGTITGRVEDFDGDELRIDGRTFSLSGGDVRQIDLRLDDPVGNGALIGAGIGTGLVLATCVAVGADCAEFILVLGGLYAGAGAGLGTLFDALHRGREVVYVAPSAASERKLTVVPLFTRDKKGVLVSLGL